MKKIFIFISIFIRFIYKDERKILKIKEMKIKDYGISLSSF
jgi:hypothetical protein